MQRNSRKRDRATFELPLEKIISGGQTGADIAGLKAAAALGYQTGGTSHRQVGYGLTVMKGRGVLVRRSKKNVDDSDATVAFRTKSSPGTDKTIGYCATGVWKGEIGRCWSCQNSPKRPKRSCGPFCAS